jgi:hypothetical protein
MGLSYVASHAEAHDYSSQTCQVCRECVQVKEVELDYEYTSLN